MIPATDLLRQPYHSFGCCFHGEKTSLIPTLMADEEASRAGFQEEEKELGGAEEGDIESTTSREEDERHHHGGWLQLGIGGSSSSVAWSTAESPAELQLFSARPPYPRAAIRPPQLPTMISPALGVSHRPEASWGFRSSDPRMMMTAGLPPAARMLYDYRGFGHFPASSSTSSSGGGEGAMRVVISPPRRLQAGVWFALQAAPNQVREPFLPQIQNSFLRIRDDSMTVRLLMKYLANKLGLENESEVEIACRGQQLLPFWTLLHVRDSIWCRRDPVILHLDSPATDHVMILHYRRSV